MDRSSSLLLYVCTLNLFFCTTRLLAKPIVGGFTDSRNVHKHHATIYQKGDDEKYHLVCGATIISEKHILTAAHCFMTKIVGIVTQRSALGNGRLKAIAGTSHLNGLGPQREIIRIFIPDEFNIERDEHTRHANIAVAELRSDLGVQSLHTMKMLSIGEPLTNEAGKEALFCGFGLTRTNRIGNRYIIDISSTPQTKQCLNVYMMSESACVNYHSTICAIGATPDHTSCEGDGGAGLVFDRHVVGVLSHSPPNCHFDSVPMTFTRTSGFNDFVIRAMVEGSERSDMHIFAENIQL